MPPDPARDELIDAARAVVEAAAGMTFSSGALLKFTRGLEELRNALAGKTSTKAGFVAVAEASRKVVEGANTDDLIKARRGAGFVGALRRLRYALRELEPEPDPGIRAGR